MKELAAQGTVWKQIQEVAAERRELDVSPHPQSDASFDASRPRKKREKTVRERGDKPRSSRSRPGGED